MIYFKFQFGATVADSILKMAENGMDIDKLHLVGHSLGAHLSSIVAKFVKSKSQNSHRIKRITGLDPANVALYNWIYLTFFIPNVPGFIPSIIHIEYLSKDDADLVDVIHT